MTGPRKAAPTTAPEVVAGVLRLANEVHGLAKAAQRPDLTGPLAEQAARWKDATTTVVLAGAQKRGKSRLLNSLVGRPDLLPVDADIATHTQVALVHGPALRVTVQRVDGGRAEVDPAELPAYASVLGDPAVLRDVAGLEVAVDAPLLDGLRLVDTPGVDSLTLGHRHATMGALATADTLLFAVSAQDQPVLRHELEFLAEAAQRVPAVAFVLTKVEDSTSWRDLLRENRERLARFCGPDGPGVDERVATLLREAPWLPVSAKLGDAALALDAAGHAERAAARRERSGLPALQRHVRRYAERRETVRAAGVLALATAGLRALGEPERDRAAGADVAGSIDVLSARRAAVEADLEALAALRRERRRRAIDHSLLGRRIGNRARARLDAHRRGYEREIGELSTPKAVAAYAETLPESVGRTFAAAWREIAADTEQAVAAALPAYLREMGVDPGELDAVELAAPVRGPGALHAEGAGGRFDLVGEGMPAVMMAGSMGLLSSHLFGLLAIGGAAAVLAPLAIGGALAGTLLAHRRRVAEAARNRTALTKALGDAFTVAAGEMVLAVEQATAAWRASAEQAVDAAFAARQTELEGRRRELAGLAAQDATERRKAAAAAAERLEKITAAQGRAAELAVSLRAVSLRVGASPAGSAPAGD